MNIDLCKLLKIYKSINFKNKIILKINLLIF